MPYGDAHYTLKRLEKLAEKCGVRKPGSLDEDDRPGVDLSKMSPYERQQYQTAVTMQRVRSAIAELDGIGENGSAMRRTEVAQRIRKGIHQLKLETTEAKKFAKNEGKKSEYETLVAHVKKTEALYTQRFQAPTSAEAGAAANAAQLYADGTPKRVVELDDAFSELKSPMVNLREDEEFALFFQQVQKNDAMIDQALDRIAAGVQMLHQNAKNINEELKVQHVLLTETEEKVATTHGKLKSVNKRLKKTIKDVEKDRLCVYLLCFILLLALGGVIYWQITKSSDQKKQGQPKK